MTNKMKTLNPIFNRPQIIFIEKEGAEMLAKTLEARYNMITSHQDYIKMMEDIFLCATNIKNKYHNIAKIAYYIFVYKEMNKKIAKIFYPQFNLN